MSTELDDLEEFNQRIDNDVRYEEDATRSRSYPEDVDVDGVKQLLSISRLNKWAVYGGKRFRPCEDAVECLESGLYSVECSNELGIFFERKTVNIDELMVLPDTISEKVIKDIKHFWTKESKYRDLGFLWKRGFLFWGPAGSGKTSTVQMVIKEIVAQNGLAVLVDNPDLAGRGLTMLREVEKKRPLVVILEDIDAIIHQHGDSALLSLMDGEIQIDNVVFIATTNYPERLDRRLVNRPSRFDVVQKIGMPNKDAREFFLKAKTPELTSDQLERWVNDTNGFSVAHLKELIISVQALDVPYENAVSRLLKMSEVPSSSSFDRKVGFNFNNNDGDE